MGQFSTYIHDPPPFDPHPNPFDPIIRSDWRRCFRLPKFSFGALRAKSRNFLFGRCAQKAIISFPGAARKKPKFSFRALRGESQNFLSGRCARRTKIFFRGATRKTFLKVWTRSKIFASSRFWRSVGAGFPYQDRRFDVVSNLRIFEGLDPIQNFY